MTHQGAQEHEDEPLAGRQGEAGQVCVGPYLRRELARVLMQDATVRPLLLATVEAAGGDVESGVWVLELAGAWLVQHDPQEAGA